MHIAHALRASGEALAAQLRSRKIDIICVFTRMLGTQPGFVFLGLFQIFRTLMLPEGHRKYRLVLIIGIGLHKPARDMAISRLDQNICFIRGRLEPFGDQSNRPFGLLRPAVWGRRLVTCCRLGREPTGGDNRLGSWWKH